MKINAFCLSQAAFGPLGTHLDPQGTHFDPMGTHFDPLDVNVDPLNTNLSSKDGKTRWYLNAICM